MIIVERAARLPVAALCLHTIIHAAKTTPTENRVSQGDAVSNRLSVAPAPAKAVAGRANGNTQQAEQLSTAVVDVAVAVTPTARSLEGAAAIKFVIGLNPPVCNRMSRQCHKRPHSACRDAGRNRRR